MTQREIILNLLSDAYEVECHGVEIYTDLAKNIEAGQVKDLFNRMADDERKHAEIVMKVRNFGEKQGKWDEIGEIYQGIPIEQIMVFPQIDPFEGSDILSISRDATLLESLEAMYRIEKRQYDLYSRLADIFEDQSARNIFNVLANEERKHALKIAEQYKRCED